MRWSLLVGIGLLVLAVEPVAAQVAQPPMRWVPAHSSNQSYRSSRMIDMIVIHTIEGSEAGGISWFRNSRSNVSAHYVVSRGGRITRMVQDKNIAWHVRNYNSQSIGIENEGYAHRNTWTASQYRSLARLVAYLTARHRIPIDRRHIRGHNELDPSRRSDPGPYFNWTQFLNMVRAERGGRSAPPPRTGGSTNTTTNTGGSTSTRPPVASSGRGVLVTASALNVRTRPWGTVLGSIRGGTRFVLTGRSSGSWLEIYWGGRQAWVHGGYLRGSGGQAQSVSAGWLNVRTGPSTGYRRIGAVRSGQRYFQIGSSGAWRKIQYDSRGGWSHGSYLRSVQVSR